MRQLILGFILALGLAGAATAYDQPKALLEAIYAPYTTSNSPGDREQYYSARLRGLTPQIAAVACRSQSFTAPSTSGPISCHTRA